jgi:hypothetical protein
MTATTSLLPYRSCHYPDCVQNRAVGGCLCRMPRISTWSVNTGRRYFGPRFLRLKTAPAFRAYRAPASPMLRLHSRNVHSKQEDGASTSGFHRPSKRRDSYGGRPSRCRAAPRGSRSFGWFWDCASGNRVGHPGATGLAPAQNLLRQGNIDGARPPGHHQRSHDIAGEIPCRTDL